MKRFLSIFIMIVILLTFTACENATSQQTASPTAMISPTVEATATPDPTTLSTPTEAPALETPAPTTDHEELTGPLLMIVPAMPECESEPTDEVNARSATCYYVDDNALVILATYTGLQPLDALMDLRFESMENAEAITISPIDGLETQAMRFQVGESRDASIVDAVTVYSEGDTYLFMSIVSKDAYEGTGVDSAYSERVAEWIASIKMEVDS